MCLPSLEDEIARQEIPNITAATAATRMATAAATIVTQVASHRSNC